MRDDEIVHSGARQSQPPAGGWRLATGGWRLATKAQPHIDTFHHTCYVTAMADHSGKFSLGLVQMAASGDAAANLEKAVSLSREAASRGAQIVCLQELFRTQYFCQREDSALFDLAETVPGPTTGALARVAAEKNVVVLAPVFERRAPGVYHNSLAVLDAGGDFLGVYRKMHLPDDPQYFEKFYFAPGDRGYRVFNTRYGRIGTLICWDQWYPEAARITALMGAEVIVYPTAIGWLPADKPREGPAQRDAWITIQRAHAIANGVFVAAVNRVGREGPPGAGLEFWGSSFVADPFGVILAEASPDREEILVVECDRSRVEAVRRGWPFLRDRRIESYGPLGSRFIDD